MFKKALIAMAAAEALSLLAFIAPMLALPALVIIGIATLWLAVKNPEWGIYVLFGELFVGSRGHLLEAGPVSLRMVVFGAVFLAWVVREIRGIGEMRVWRGLPRAYWVLLIVIAFGIGRGIMGANGLQNVFYDANGYLYLLILPAVLSVVKSREVLDKIFEILGAAIIVIATKGFLLFLWFAFGLPGVAAAYHWVINQDIGEITGHVGTASRIFMQSQFWALVGMFIWGIGGNLKVSATKSDNVAEGFRPPLRWIILFSAVFSVVLSLSRSFWLGAAAAGMFAGGAALYRGYQGDWGYMGMMLKRGAVIVLLALASFGFIWGLGRLSGGVSETVQSRGLNPAAEAAGGARLLLLPELLSAIRQQPIFGAGFGEEVTYKSYLPDRVTEQNPDGEVTTYSFEWGYLDTALKIGTLGLIVYLLLIAGIFARGLQAVNFQFSIFHPSGDLYDNFQTLGILAGLVALVVLNNTTPYLNHPLGIGYLIFVYSYLSVFRKEA